MIIPSVIGKDFSEVLATINRVSSFVEWTQIDVSDGKFTPATTWPYNEGGDIDELRKFLNLSTRPKVELHLMVSNPEETIDKWLGLKPEKIFVHYESTEKLSEILRKIKATETVAGVVLNMETPVEVVREFLGELDEVLLMSIDTLGSYGAKFNPEVIDKIRGFRSMSASVTMGIDGGVNLRNARDLISAGADNLVVGSAILRGDDVAIAVKEFNEISK